MKVGIAQINAVVGDFPGNAKRILAAYRECLEAGAELVITPELSLVGNPPRDLIYRSEFVPKCLQALDYLADEVKEVPLVVGYVDINEESSGKLFRNAAAWLEKGEVRKRFWKNLLVSHDVFDEERYFEAGDGCLPYEWKGKKIGVTIGQDIWGVDHLECGEYYWEPVEELFDEGVDLLLNLSASPFHLGKPEERRKALARVGMGINVPAVCCNAVGGNDQLIYDGHSMVVDGHGNITAQLGGFVEECRVVDPFTNDGTGEDIESCEEEQIYQALVQGLRDYVQKCGFNSVCLGLSGGIDSALVAVIAADAVGPENVYGLTMPSPYSSEGSVTDAFALAKNIGIHCQEVSISGAFSTVKEAMAPVFERKEEDTTEENMQARLRGLFLMSLSNKDNHLLLAASNKSELAIGYTTIYGDMCGGISVISDVPKTKVFKLSRWLNRDGERIPWSTIEKPPSAELRPDQKDADTLPEYEVLDGVLELYLTQHLSVEEIVAKGYDENTVRWIQRRVDFNEWKRQQAAPTLRISTKAFGIGRRMPVVQKF